MVALVKCVDGRVSFKCPGCKLSHSMPVAGKTSSSVEWEFNGDVDKPTLSPSILARGGCCYEPNWHQSEKHGEPCDKGSPDEDGISMCHVCHSFVRDGRIEFLGDCTHELAGNTVDMLPV